MTDSVDIPKTQPIPFKAETRQLLNILVHSLYTDREIFLRELISNASDALTRADFEILTNREVLDPDAELGIWIVPDAEENTLTIRDTGIGMTEEELVENLGTIAHSGARAFIEAAQEGEGALADIIGQFGVGFYSAFMVADWIKVVSRSYQTGAQAAAWHSSGEDTFAVETAEKDSRGTEVIIKLKDDAEEFTQEGRLREIIRKHSDFVPFPIYFDDQEEQVNRQTALWRQSPREVEKQAYEDFYKQLTLDFEAPLTYTHMVVDAPVQMYAVLYVPSDPERKLFSARKDEGLKLYARKILIQEYCKDLLPEYLRFVQGVVDSEDLPLNISRESIQSNRLMAQLKKLVTSKVTGTLEELAKDDTEAYAKFWEAYSAYIKQGVAIEQTEPEKLYPLLRFHTTTKPDELTSLDDYVARMKPDQEEIYFILGDDQHSVLYSPHLDIVGHYDYEVLLLTDPLDSFMLVKLKDYHDHALVNVANADLEMPETQEESDAEPEAAMAEADHARLVQRFKDKLGERVTDVRMTARLSGSPARLADPEGALNQEMQRVYRLLDKDFEAPKKVLELNPRHPILVRLNQLPEDSQISPLIMEQIYENALLIEGLHPEPASMVGRIQRLIEEVLGKIED